MPWQPVAGRTAHTATRHVSTATCGDRPAQRTTYVYFQPLAHRRGTTTRKRLIELCAIVAVKPNTLLRSGLARLLFAMVNVRMVGHRFVLRQRRIVVTLRKQGFVSIVLERRQTVVCLDRKCSADQMLLLFQKVNTYLEVCNTDVFL